MTGSDRSNFSELRIFRAFILALFFAGGSLSAQESVTLVAGASETFKILEKYNLSKYVDGKYSGHVYREVRAVIDSERKTDGSLGFDGTFFVGEETLRDAALVEKRIDDAVSVSFSVSPEGSFRFEKDPGYPDLRDFPTYPSASVSPGKRWEGQGTRIVDPDNKGIKTRVTILSEFEYRGIIVYKGATVHSIAAKYATRYKRGQDRNGDPELERLEGTHDVRIVLAETTFAPILMSETIDEQYRFVSGRQVRLKGTILTFWSAVPTMDKPDQIATLKQTFDDAGISGVDVRERPEGIGLSLKDIHFVADSDKVLPDETGRLDVLAKALKEVKGERTLMVEGHTADIGQRENQYALSELRARMIVAELSKRGISASRFLFKGYGADRPVAPNDTETNRARNRRVEIVILQD